MMLHRVVHFATDKLLLLNYIKPKVLNISFTMDIKQCQKQQFLHEKVGNAIDVDMNGPRKRIKMVLGWYQNSVHVVIILIGIKIDYNDIHKVLCCVFVSGKVVWSSALLCWVMYCPVK